MDGNTDSKNGEYPEQETDLFARIALGDHPLDKDELCEVLPLEINKKYFKTCSQKADYVNLKSYEEKLVSFYEELKGLREKYRQFMADFTPRLRILRKQWEQREFQFRYETEEDKKDFRTVLEGKGLWEAVIIPDYRGPIGKWTGFYRREFCFDGEKKQGKRIFLKFLGADYIANVYLNGRYAGSHEGIFAPFEFDVTDYLHYNGLNILVVEIKNDAPTLGLSSWDSNQNVDGDKIYAATGIGWNDPYLGWHHCPPGAGLYNRVIFEERSEIFVHSLFVRPDIDNSAAEVWIEIYNCLNTNQDISLKLSIYPRNFRGEAISDIACETAPAGPGINYYRFTLPMENYRLWSPDEPWLYTVRASLYKDDEALLDEFDNVFGMRKFHMDEEGEPKGSLYLNNKPVILRGANDMGHMQLCVMKGDYEQLVDDILIAKLANMNYYRFTQRPVQEEIYHYCDMLGMMNQTDLPLFGYIRRNQFVEAVRQSREMERLIRSHPSAIMVTFINEPFSARNKKAGHRHLYRDEMEDFFDCARKVVKLENPDRVIKNVEGDYDPPTRTGLSDFHCYNMWYTNHALPIGKLYKGYLPPIKKGWKTGCGEYGVEGLDPVEVMMEDYPKEWIPEDPHERWTPEKIVRAQTYSMHGDWYEEQHSMVDWIRESQEHQAYSIKMMTDAFRRRSDVLVSTAVHLLIDAWPSGWMKTLVDHRRKPKPAYFSFRDSLVPLRVNLRTDRFTVYDGDLCEIEAWILNDTTESYRDCKIMATVRNESRDFESFEITADAKAAYPNYAGTIAFKAPAVKDREKLHIDAVLVDNEGNKVNSERLTLEVFEKYTKVYMHECVPEHKSGHVPGSMPEYGSGMSGSMDGYPINDGYPVDEEKNEPVAARGKTVTLGMKAGKLAEALGIETAEFGDLNERPETIIISEWDEFLNRNTGEDTCAMIINWVKEGSVALILIEDFEVDRMLKIDNREVKIRKMNGLTFVARDRNESITKGFGAKDFSFWYNKNKDYIDIIADRFIETDQDGFSILLFTYQKPRFSEQARGEKQKLPIAGFTKLGKGKLVITTLRTDGFAGVNPVLDRFLMRIICNEDKN